MKSDTLVEALKQISENPETLAVQGRNVAERVRENFSWAKTAEATLKAFEAVQRKKLSEKDQPSAVMR